MHEIKKEDYLAGNELAFMFEEWTGEQFAIAGKNIRNRLKELQLIRKPDHSDIHCQSAAWILFLAPSYGIV